MARGIVVPITGTVLDWAIRESGYTPQEVAGRVRVDGKTLEAWKQGRAQPTLTQFRKLAAVLKRPTATFLLPEPPVSLRPPVEFRHPPGTTRSSLNPNELRHLREASRLQRVLAWMLGEMEADPVSLPKVEVGSTTEDVGQVTRTRLRVSVEEQVRWHDSSRALSGWRLALQDTGVAVFLFPLGKESCRGFSLWDGRAPLIAVNTWWNNEARMFTLFHEYAHLLTRTNSACMQSVRWLLDREADREERWCEGFAAAVLMPWSAVTAFMESELGWSPGQTFDQLEPVRRVARAFKVSLRAATLRLIGQGIATWALYKQIPEGSDAKGGGGGGEGRNRIKVREDAYGTGTIQLFVAGMKRDLVTRAQVLSYLDVADADLDRLEGQLTVAEA